MSVKPLDLQVNINAAMRVGKEEAEKIARRDEEQRQIDMKAVSEAQKRNERVAESESSTKNLPLKDTESHFGAKTITEQEAEIYKNDKRQKQKKESEESKKEKKTLEKESEEDNGHIDFLA
ncbi:MAG: hypothetical protein OEZ22_12080 [Spirochaetia bacterium]|nr:hypothetical protein [Spirochaetia bacterium]